MCDAIMERTQIGRESGEGSHFDGKRVSLGSDDGFSDYLSFLLSQGKDVCEQVIRDPESMVPPANWEHFDVQVGDGLRPQGEEGFLQYPLMSYMQRARRAAH